MFKRGKYLLDLATLSSSAEFAGIRSRNLNQLGVIDSHLERESNFLRGVHVKAQGVTVLNGCFVSKSNAYIAPTTI